MTTNKIFKEGESMNHLVKSIKWTKHNGYTIWWGPNRSGYTDCIYDAGIYSEEEAKHLEELHGKSVCKAIPYDEGVVKLGIKQQQRIVSECEKQIKRYNEYIKHEENHIENAKKKIADLEERIKI